MTRHWLHGAPRTLALLLALAAPGSGAAQAPDTLRLSLTRAVDRALEQSEEIAAARARLAGADARLTQARAAGLPQVSAALTYNRTIASVFEALSEFQGADSLSIPSAFDPARPARERYDTLSSLITADFMAALIQGLPFGRPNTYMSVFQVSQPLFAGGRITGARTAARHALRATEHQLEETQAEIVLQVREAYLNAVLARRLHTIANESRRIAAEHLQQVELFCEAGTASQFDRLRARVDLENREPDVVRADNLVRVALLNLKRLVNLPAEQPVALTSSFALEPVEVDEPAIAGLMLDRPALLASREMVSVREAGVRSAKGEWFPTVGAQLNLGFQAFPAGVAPPGFSQWRKDWSVALAFSWQLFDGFGRQGRTGEAQSLLREARAQQDQLEEGLRLELSQALGDYHAAVAQRRAREETVRLAEETHALAELRFRSGLATQLEVSDVALLLDQARVNEIQALADYVKALARLERLAGGRLSLLRETQP